MPNEERKLSPEEWFHKLKWKPADFQKESWKAIANGREGIVNAPTGSGKTYAVLLQAIYELAAQGKTNGLKMIWISPIKALAKEIEQSTRPAVEGMNIEFSVNSRTGDSTAAQRAKIKKNPPNLLITTPESLHLMLATKGYPQFFRNLAFVVCDEWHELVGSKRAVLMELALSRLRTICPNMRSWGISATIGNMPTAMDILLGPDHNGLLIRSGIKKEIAVHSIFPDTLDELPWAGHLGARLLRKVLPKILSGKSTLIFTNTRSQTEIWYQKILEAAPELAGQMAMHHGSMSREIRDWVEEALHEGSLRAVVCTSSLDLGVDFRPVEQVIQIGSPKGAARFLQRAGRSGHSPGQISKIYFLPTHSLELIEAAALRVAAREEVVEDRQPFVRSFDVGLQFMVTLAVSEGFKADQLFEEFKRTYSFNSLSDDEWDWMLNFICYGGKSLNAYDEFHKVIFRDGLFKVESRAVARRHRMSIGVIVSDASLSVRYKNGKYLGSIEEWFISRLKPGDVFIMAGKTLEFVRIKEMTAIVKPSKAKKGIVPSWGGGRMPLSAQLAGLLRKQLHSAYGRGMEKEIEFLIPLFDRQSEESIVPTENEFLLEYLHTSEGYHLLVYPFEGRFVHEGMAALLAYRLSLIKPISFSIAMNDYGFELLSDQPIPVDAIEDNNLFTTDYLEEDILASINASEMGRRKFRDIASISGLVFKGFPGKQQKEKHLQSSAQLFYNVFSDYENDNLLLLQAHEEVMQFQLEQGRMRMALARLANQQMRIMYPSKPGPFAFPIMVDRLREKLSSEKLRDRIRRMELEWEDE